MINTPDLYTFFAHSGNSSSIIDLTFANSKIKNAITNWSIDENAVTGSDHEVIRFELIASFKNLTSHATALSNKYNCNKADWDKFAKFLDENAINYESRIQSLLNNYQFDESALYLQNIIKNVAEMFIPKTKICAKSKNWWSQDLSGLRKIMCRHRREWENNPSFFSHQTFRHSRIEYFHAIRKAKQQTWFFLFYLFIKCIQPKVMTLNYFRICFYITNKSTLYNPSMYCQFFPIFTPC